MSSGGTATPVGAADRATRRAAAWLGRHGMNGVTPSPLLVARLRVRRRITAALLVAAVAIGVVVVVRNDHIAGDSIESWRGSAVDRLAGTVALVLFVVLARAVAMRAVRRADRRIGAALTRRVTRATPLGWRAVLNRRRAAIAVVNYGGAVGLGVAAAVLANNGNDRLVVAVALLGVVAVAALGAAQFGAALRRPALAEDAVTLAADDALRVDDAREQLISPLPALLVTLAGTSLTPSVTSSLATFGCVLIVFNALAVIWDLETSRGAPVLDDDAPAATS
jgi:hypothetical protein